jgi:hypothetical protein
MNEWSVHPPMLVDPYPSDIWQIAVERPKGAWILDLPVQTARCFRQSIGWDPKPYVPMLHIDCHAVSGPL